VVNIFKTVTKNLVFSPTNQAGGFGLFSYHLMAFVFLTGFMNGVNYYAQVFLFVAPPHDCSSPGNVNETYDFAEIFPTLTSENDWVCENDDKPNYVEMVFWSGNIIGFLLWGYTNDSFGRRPTIVISHIVYTVGNIMTFVFTDFPSILICRFLVGSAHMTISHLPYMLAIEFCGEKHRTYPLFCLMASYGLSSIFTPVLAMYLSSWQSLLMVATIPNIIVIIAGLFSYIPESIRWQVCKGKPYRVLETVQKMAKVNSVEFSEKKLCDIEMLISYAIQSPNPSTTNEVALSTRLQKNSKFSLRAVLTLLLCFICFTCYFGHVGNTANLGSNNRFLPFVYGAGIEMLVVFSVPSSLNRLGRRWSIVTMLLTCCLFSGFFCAFTTPPGELQGIYSTIFAVASRVCAAGAYYACLQFASELFPTEIRGKGSSAFEISGGLGLFIQPQINYLAKSLDSPSVPVLVYGGLCLLAIFIALLLPETANEELPQTIEEANIFGSSQTYLHCIICSQRKDHDKDVTTIDAEIPEEVSPMAPSTLPDLVRTCNVQNA